MYDLDEPHNNPKYGHGLSSCNYVTNQALQQYSRYRLFVI